MSMGDIFWELLNRSITASWSILAVLCIRPVFRKIPKWVNCILWGMVAVRLICPFSVESQFSILSSTEPVRSSTIVQGEVLNYIPSIDSDWAIVENTINPMLTETFAYNETESAAPLQVVIGIAGIVWVCGMVLLMAYAVGSMIRLHELVKESVCYRDNLYICDAVRSPFILGVIRPRIYLSSALSGEEINYITAHELAHLRRKDHWWKPLGYLLLCIYWFNPLCWAAYVLFCKDIELSCDEKAIEDMTFPEKKEYSRVLLSCTQQRRSAMVYPLAFGEVGIKDRVKSVLHYKKPALWIMIVAVIVCAIMAVGFLTNPIEESKEILDNTEVKAAALEEDNESGQSAEQEHDDEEYISLESVEAPVDESSVSESSEPENFAVAGITVTNGNNGEEKTFRLADSDNGFRNLLRLYESLDFSAETEEAARSGYRYSMKLYDVEGEMIHIVTPYKDGFSMDGLFYRYSGTYGYDRDSVNLMNYMDLLFYPAEENEATKIEEHQSEPLDEENMKNGIVTMTMP